MTALARKLFCTPSLLAANDNRSQKLSLIVNNNGNRLTVTNARSFVTTQAFDPINRLTSVKSALNQTASRVIDNRDNITTQRDFRTLATTYVYNGFNQAIQVASPDSGTTVYNTVDKAGNVTQETDARGIVTNRTFDALNRVLTQTFPAVVAENMAYTYDAIAGGNKGKGHLTSVTDQSGSTAYVYDERGNITQKTAVISGKTYTTSYAYDLSDKPTVITYPSGRQVQYLYNAQGQLTTVNSRATSGGSYTAVASSVTFEPFGPLKSFTYGNGLTHARDYDQNYWISTLQTKNGAAFLRNLTYGYDNAGNITSIADGVTPARNQTFTYDALDRLTQGVGAYGTINYTYYTPSDRQTRVTGGVTQTYSFPGASNRMTSITNSPATRSFTYTTNGNILTDDRSTAADVAYTWSNRNRKATVTVGGTLAATYLYDSAGQRVSKVAGATTTHFIYDLNGRLIAEANGTTGATTREFIWTPDGLPLAQVETGSVFWYVLSDHLGTPQKLTDSTKAIVWDRVQQPFGETQTTTGTANSSIRFPGQYADAEDGNYYNYFRDYDSTMGRYLQTDPIGQAGGVNLYKYAESNPLKYTDPRGENPFVAIPAFCAMNPAACATIGAAGAATCGILYNTIAGDDAVNTPFDVHGNSNQSQRPTEVYYLINRTTGAIDKIGITSNPQGRYPQSYLDIEGVEYVRQTQYNSRLPAKVDENIRLNWYQIEHGQLPRLNKTTY